MKEAVAAAVLFEPAAKIGPSLDLVDRLIFSRLFQNHRRSMPVNALQDQKSAIKPGCEKMRKIGRNWLPLDVLANVSKQIGAHLNQGMRAARYCVQTPEQFLTRRFHGPVEMVQVGPDRILAICFRRPSRIALHAGWGGEDPRSQQGQRSRLLAACKSKA